MERITRTFEITTSIEVMKRLERFLALLHFNSNFGHSGIFAMPLDGDGSDKVSVKGMERALCHEVDLIGGVGYDIEIAYNTTYSGADIDKEKKNKWCVKRSASLFKNDEVRKTIAD